MIQTTRLAWPLFGCVAFAIGNRAAAQVTFTSPPRASPAELAVEIANAPADQLYFVEATLARPSSVGEIRAVSSQLEVPRALAYIELGPYVGARPSGMTILALGRMHGSEAARRYAECRALVTVNFGENELRHSPIDEWPVSRLALLASAHVIRELSSGRLLPPIRILDGGPQSADSFRKTEDYARNEITQLLTKPSSVDLPAYCSEFVGAQDAPTLSSGFPRDFRPPAPQQGETFRQLAFRLLGQLPRDTAVTINLKVDFPADVDWLASLVREYGINGMRAELLPEQSSQRVLVDAQLTHTLELAGQVQRIRCQARIGAPNVRTSGEWYADWISVSLSTENAVRLLSHPNLAQATVTGSHPVGDLDRLKGYFERLATTIYEMPRSIEIPAGCEDVYRHNGQEDVGSVSVRPFTAR
jgi:hypothetical protein